MTHKLFGAFDGIFNEQIKVYRREDNGRLALTIATDNVAASINERPTDRTGSCTAYLSEADAKMLRAILDHYLQREE